MKKIEVIVAVDVDGASDRAATLAGAEGAGLRIDAHSRDSQLGYLSGVIDADALAKLRAVKGVLSVETARTMRPIPPDDPVQ